METIVKSEQIEDIQTYLNNFAKEILSKTKIEPSELQIMIDKAIYQYEREATQREEQSQQKES